MWHNKIIIVTLLISASSASDFVTVAGNHWDFKDLIKKECAARSCAGNRYYEGVKKPRGCSGIDKDVTAEIEHMLHSFIDAYDGGLTMEEYEEFSTEDTLILFGDFSTVSGRTDAYERLKYLDFSTATLKVDRAFTSDCKTAYAVFTVTSTSNIDIFERTLMILQREEGKWKIRMESGLLVPVAVDGAFWGII